MSRERELLNEVSWQLEAFIDGGYWPNTHILLDDINKELAKPEHDPLSDDVIAKEFSKKDCPAHLFDLFADGVRFAEKAHGITE